jgi:DNA-binding transcriptional regulator YdaS (Cro superfamily)
MGDPTLRGLPLVIPERVRLKTNALHRALAYQRGWSRVKTIKALADILGVSHSAVSAWANGRTAPARGDAERICRILGVAWSDLVSEVEGRWAS